MIRHLALLSDAASCRLDNLSINSIAGCMLPHSYTDSTNKEDFDHLLRGNKQDLALVLVRVSIDGQSAPHGTTRTASSCCGSSAGILGGDSIRRCRCLYYRSAHRRTASSSSCALGA